MKSAVVVFLLAAAVFVGCAAFLASQVREAVHVIDENGGLRAVVQRIWEGKR